MGSKIVFTKAPRTRTITYTVATPVRVKPNMALRALAYIAQRKNATLTQIGNELGITRQAASDAISSLRNMGFRLDVNFSNGWHRYSLAQ